MCQLKAFLPYSFFGSTSPQMAKVELSTYIFWYLRVSDLYLCLYLQRLHLVQVLDWQLQLQVLLEL